MSVPFRCLANFCHIPELNEFLQKIPGINKFCTENICPNFKENVWLIPGISKFFTVNICPSSILKYRKFLPISGLNQFSIENLIICAHLLGPHGRHRLWNIEHFKCLVMIVSICLYFFFICFCFSPISFSSSVEMLFFYNINAFSCCLF